MRIEEFIEALGNEREFQLQVSGHEYIEPRKARHLPLDLDGRIRAGLGDRGIHDFYSHQAEAINSIRDGRHVLLMTPTASGKSLVYNIPVLESVLADAQTNALYLYPLKGLEQDQFRNLSELAASLGLHNAGQVYDGDTPPAQRKKIREALPHVIFTNPDMLHLGLLPFHRKWEEFFRHLRYVVIDEIHSYRGVFGSHVSQVFRRLRRLCDYYGSAPRFIAASATIANPEALAEGLTGLPFSVIQESGAPSSGRHFFFVNPIESPYTVATRLFARCIQSGIRTILFTKARKITELIYSWALDYIPDLAEKISPYRAGFLPRERREIEARLFSGELLGVISTSALEVGVDIGGLDCCILCGYPGSVSSTWQRAGRVGRQGRESLVALIAIEDALDHYFVRHPGAFFKKSHEAAVVDPGNSNILKQHLLCAAAELLLRRDDGVYAFEAVEPLINELTDEKALLKGKRAEVWSPANRRPHRDVGIRAIGQRFSLVNEAGGTIGELSGSRVYREAFPGAIYLHRGRRYQVLELDLLRRKAVCGQTGADYYTQSLSADTTEIIDEKEQRDFGSVRFSWGRLRITQRVAGYDKKRTFDGKKISTHSLDLPEHVFETEGVWTVISKKTGEEIGSRGFDLGGAIHAVEHAAIACMPLFSLCDRGDIGGLSHTQFPDFGLPAIFIYDGHEGGVGLARRALDVAPEWLETTLSILQDCPCEGGCPSCVQDPHCGNRNEPLDKRGAMFLLGRWLAGCREISDPALEPVPGSDDMK